MGTLLTEEQIALRKKCWEERVRTDEAARLCGIKIKHLQEWYCRNGYTHETGGLTRKNRSSIVTPQIIEEIIDLRCRGLSLQQIADLAGFSRSTIRTYLRKEGYR